VGRFFPAVSGFLAEASFGTPERNLLAGILERAHRDLGAPCVDTRDRRDAIKWVLNTKEIHCDTFISFKDCIEGLELSASQVYYMEECARLSAKLLYDEAIIKSKKGLNISTIVELKNIAA